MGRSRGPARHSQCVDGHDEPAHRGPRKELPARQLLELQLDELVGSARSVALLCISVDRIEDIIHALGRQLGDEVLMRVTDVLGRELGEHGAITRSVDNRYAIILPGADCSGAAKMAAAIASALRKPIVVDAYHFRVSASVGIAVSSEGARAAGTLLAQAEAALHEAMSRGGDRYQIFTAQIRQTAIARLTLESELRRGIEEGELELHYQPTVCLRTQTISSAEALVRWRSQTRGLLFPDEFIPMAERSGLIVPLGEWVIEAACRHASASWHESAGNAVAVCVNMSPAQLRMPGIAGILEAALIRHALPPSRLEIEITESAAMADIHCATASLLEIAELGVRLSLDDFGTGYSNLGQLARLPISTLKIARPLVTGIAMSSRDAVVVRATIEMAHALRMKVVAEGVETNSQLSVLREAGCDDVQGYLIAKPMDARAFAAWLAQWNGSAVAEQAPVAPRLPA